MGIVKGLPLTAVCKDPPTALKIAHEKFLIFEIAICNDAR